VKHGAARMVEEAERDVKRALDELSEVANSVGQPLRLQARAKLEQWARLVVQWAGRAGLTSLTSPGSVVRELMTPAVFALRVVEISKETQVVDLGCGSGCTGVTLAGIAGCGRWHLVDRAQRKVTFCRYALRQCGIAGVRAMSREECLREKVQGEIVLARALPRSAETAEDVRRMGVAGGTVVRWVSSPVEGKPHSVAKCDAANLWVAASSVGRFT